MKYLFKITSGKSEIKLGKSIVGNQLFGPTNEIWPNGLFPRPLGLEARQPTPGPADWPTTGSCLDHIWPVLLTIAKSR
jgi:hypothetical protein